MLDIKQPDRTDLLDSATWSTVESRLRERHFDALLMSPPCGTFSSALAQNGVHPYRTDSAPGNTVIPNLIRKTRLKPRKGRYWPYDPPSPRTSRTCLKCRGLPKRHLCVPVVLRYSSCLSGQAWMHRRTGPSAIWTSVCSAPQAPNLPLSLLDVFR